MISRLVLIFTLFIVFWIFEYFSPAELGQSFIGKGRNIILTLIYLFVGTSLTAIVHGYFPMTVKYIPEHGSLFSLFFIIFYIFMADIIFYWYHRAQHKFKAIWVIHELHHSDAELNVTTSMRSYLLENPIQFLVITTPIVYLLGTSQGLSQILGIVLTAWLLFTHANLKIHLGLLSSVICGPQVHRIHHSNLPEHQNKNFAQFFPIIDIIFGTFYMPARNEFPTTGTPALRSDASIQTILLRPFLVWGIYLKKFLSPR